MNKIVVIWDCFFVVYYQDPVDLDGKSVVFI